MGFIDKTTHTLRCPKCDKTEQVTILQHGSAYGGSWHAGKIMSKFTVTWRDVQGFRGPEIESAKCNGCGTTPLIAFS